jgi:DNA-binding NarL/FixJ family response regulator
MPNKIKIVIADDHKLVAETWATIINLEENFHVVKLFDNSQSLIDEISEINPDIILLDVSINPISGIEATKIILEKSPDIKIIGVSMHNQPSYAKKMIRNGALGYVTKNSSKIEMYEAIEEVMKGNTYICHEIKKNISKLIIVDDVENNNFNKLTEREIEIIKLIKNGSTNKEIATMLLLSQRTVETHRSRILKKLGMKNSISLIKLMNDSFWEL